MALHVREKNVRNIPPSTFTGKYEDWEEFSWRFKAYISLTDPRAAKGLKTAEAAGDAVITEEELHARNTDGTVTDLTLLASHIFHQFAIDNWSTLSHLKVNGNLQWTRSLETFEPEVQTKTRTKSSP